MRPQRVVLGVATTLVLALALGCDRMEPTAPAAGEALALKTTQGTSVKKLSVALCSPDRPGFTIASTNPYYPLGPVGRQWILTGEEDGESIRLQVTVLNQTRVIDGVTTRVIEERETIDGESFEVRWNYFVQGGKDHKIHAAGTGIIVDGPLALEDLNQTSGVPEQPMPTDQACGV